MAPPYAFVTLLTSDSYLPGALTLAAALQDIHPSPATPPEVDFQTVCLVTPETIDIASIKLLRKAFDLVVGVEIIEENNERGLQLLGAPSPFHVAYTSYHLSLPHPSYIWIPCGQNLSYDFNLHNMQPIATGPLVPLRAHIAFIPACPHARHPLFPLYLPSQGRAF